MLTLKSTACMICVDLLSVKSSSSLPRRKVVLDVIKYCDHPDGTKKYLHRRWDLRLEVSPPIGGGTSDWWDLQLEVSPPIGGGTSDWRWDLQSEVGLQLEVIPLIGGGTSNQRWHLQLEVTPPIGGGTSNQSWDLWLEVGPPTGGGTSDWRWLMHVGPHRSIHVTCRNQLFFWKKKRDYLLLITSSRHLSTRWNVNLLGLSYVIQKDLLWSKAWNGKWAQNWQI